jgi:uncharacterized protein
VRITPVAGDVPPLRPREELRMAREIFVNLPVSDLARAVAFFSALGFAFDKRFTDEKATAMVVGEGSYVMFLHEPFFKTFTDVGLADAARATETIIALSADSRDEVDDIVTKALALGATRVRAPNDLGFMYDHGFRDLDGHVWEFVWMDPSAEPRPQPGANPRG